MKKIQKATAEKMAKVFNAMANKAGGAASGWMTYQPKEPNKNSK